MTPPRRRAGDGRALVALANNDADGANTPIFLVSPSVIICGITFPLLYDPHLIRWPTIKRGSSRTYSPRVRNIDRPLARGIGIRIVSFIHSFARRRRRDNFISLLTLAGAYITGDYNGIVSYCI